MGEDRKKEQQIAIYQKFAKIAVWLLRTINFCLVLLVIAFIINFASQFIPRARLYPAIQKIDALTQPTVNYIALLLPTHHKGIEFAPLIAVVLLFIIMHLIHMLVDQFLALKTYLARKGGQLKTVPIKAAEAGATGAEPQERMTLLKQWIALKLKLEESQKQLSFLSVDVIGSTKMKEEEDPAVIEYTFAEYKKFVEEILTANHVWKEAWTPDGMMSAFLTIDDAIKAGKEIIIGLDAFNKYVNRLKKSIRVRCGINYGKVMFDIKARMEEVTDRVIDVAGHLQKNAEPNTIWAAKDALNYLSSKDAGKEFQEIKIKVDDHEVAEWKNSNSH